MLRKHVGFWTVFALMWGLNCGTKTEQKKMDTDALRSAVKSTGLSFQSLQDASNPEQLIATPCNSRPGATKPEEGSGLCSGNLLLDLTLATLPFSLIYNSTASNVNFGVGRGFRISIDQRYFKAGSKDYHSLGDGGLAELKSGSGGKVYKDRRLNLSVFTPSSSVKILEKSPNKSIGTYSRLIPSNSSVFGLTEIKDRFNNTISFGRNALGNIESITFPNGSGIQLIYTLAGLLTEVIGVNSEKYQLRYDDLGRLIDIQQPDLSHWQLVYPQSTSLISKLTDPNGNVYEYAYYFGGLLRTFKSPNGYVSGITYTSAKVTLSGNGINHSESFSAGNRISELSNGISSTWAYDVNNRVKSFKNHYGETTIIAYKSNNPFPQTVTAPNGDFANFEYYADLTLKKVNFQDGTLATEVLYSANPVGEPESITTNGVLQQQFIYENGLLKAIKNGNRIVLATYTYDGAGNLLTETDAEGFQRSYQYSNGWVSLVSDSFGRQTQVTRDGFGNATNIQNATVRLAQTYDSIGRVSGISSLTYLASGKSLERQIFRSFYPTGAMNQWVESLRFSGNHLSITTQNFSATPAGRLSSATWQGAVGPAINLLGN
ncbi:MAG: RHS repeat protein [Deltaproteobacteria bacterium]|nr:RHS repeat protein [Deltaproteobacteria bacterium]